MAIFPHGNKVRLDFQLKGQRYVRSFNTEAEAKAWQEKAKARVALGLPADEAAEAQRDMTIGEALQKATKEWQRQKDGLGSIANGEDVASILGRSRSLSRIDQDSIEALVDALLERGLALSTVNRKLSALSKMLTIGRTAGLPITARVKFLQEPEGRVRFLSLFEEQSVLADLRNNGDTDMADAVITAIDTGLRLGELLAIRRHWLRQEGNGTWALTVAADKAKSGKARTIPLTDRVTAILQARLASSMHPWPASWNVDKVDGLWAAMRRRLGYQDDREFVFHALRHTCAVRLLEATGNLVLVRDWLGHADIRTTTIYAKVVTGTLKAGVEALQRAVA